MHTLQKRKVYVYIRVEEKNRFVTAIVENGTKPEPQENRRVYMDSFSESSWVPRLTVKV